LLQAPSPWPPFKTTLSRKRKPPRNPSNGRKPEDVARDEDYWAEIRNAFTIDRNVINLNNGYVSPAPRPVQDALRRYIEFSDMGPWHTMIDNLEKQIEMVRRRLALPPAAIRRKWPSPATPANRLKSRSAASI
jgi:hypothetical protein